MITALIPLISGNAIKILLSPPSVASEWRMLRNTTGVFSDENSLDLVAQGTSNYWLDCTNLENDISYWYKVVYFDGQQWDLSFPAAAITPTAAYTDLSVDPLSIVRNRLDVGLNARVQQGILNPLQGIIPVLVASPPLEDVQFPLVTVHVENNQLDELGIGYALSDDPDEFGWYTKTGLLITCWHQNGDERNVYRQAIKAVLLANLEVFDEAGLLQLDIAQTDTDDFENYPWPMYATQTRLSCVALTALATGPYPTLNTLTVNEMTYG